jgi:hypothetical protein
MAVSSASGRVLRYFWVVNAENYISEMSRMTEPGKS